MPDTPGPPASSGLIVITPEGSAHSWREYWAYRELLAFTVWRDLRVRYRQTLLGAAWALIQPFTTMVVFSLFFGRLAGMPSDGAPYPIFSYAALVPWTYFATAVGQGAGALVGSQQLLSKVYFPRLLIPCGAVLVPLVDAGVALGLLAVLMAWYGIVPGPALVALPAFALLAVAAALAAAVWLAALNVQYRDVRFVVPFLVQFWLFVTPVAYPTSLVPEAWRPVYALNPMATVVDGFRWALLGTPAPTAGMVVASSAATVVALGLAARTFSRMERTFADVV